jgi:hypothetical protein
MTLSGRVDIRLDPELLAALLAFATSNGLARGAAARLLMTRALREVDRPATQISPAQLAALMAAEHAVLMVASILPEGEQRMRALATRASQAAEERLAMVVEPAAPGEGSR